MAEEEPAAQPIEPLKLIVEGFKCFRDRFEFELAPLTVLAGANSSGKTSAMQPLLLLKQTLETPFDPGPLWIGGPIVQFDDWRAMVWANTVEPAKVVVGLRNARSYVETVFGISSHGASVERWHVASSALGEFDLRVGPLPADLRALLLAGTSLGGQEVAVGGNRYLFSVPNFNVDLSEVLLTLVVWPMEAIHLPGLRGNPERSYPLVPPPETFVGSFQREYVASLLWHWQEGKDQRAARIAASLAALGLTSKVQLRQISAIRVQILVGRLPKAKRGAAGDLVNIADVGLGVSQVLPVLVALEAAERGQIVIIEQPELHLHPRAQAKLAEVLVAASKRGVRVIVETHSPLLLLALQNQVARGELPTEQAVLYWFERDKEGAAVVTRGGLDESGAYRDWPVDFDVAESEVQDAYLDAAWQKLTPR